SIAIQREQAIADFHLSRSGTVGVDCRHVPAVAGHTHCPAGVLHDAVVSRDYVDRERQEDQVRDREKGHEPDKRWATLTGWGLSDEEGYASLSPARATFRVTSLPESVKPLFGRRDCLSSHDEPRELPRTGEPGWTRARTHPGDANPRKIRRVAGWRLGGRRNR